MSESAGKMRHGAEKTAKAVGATAAGAAEGRRVQSIREPLSPGAYVEYSVDDQPGVVERARAFLAGAPAESVAPRMAATVMLVSEGKPHYRRFESPLAGGAPIEETVGCGSGGCLHAAPRLHHGLHAGRRGVSRRRPWTCGMWNVPCPGPGLLRSSGPVS